MARQATITQEHVNAICDRLRAANITPSPRKILDVHGSGSLSTITPLFKKWDAGQVVAADAGKVTLPAALTNMMVDVIGQQLAAGKAELEAKLAESEQNNVDLAREGERQLAEIDALTDQVELEQQELATVRGRLEQVDADLTTARDEAKREREGAEKARTDLAKAELRLEAMPRLEGDLAAVRGDLEAERKVRIEAQQHAAVSEAQRNDLVDRLLEEKARAEQSANALQLAQEQIAHNQEQAQASIAQVQQLAQEALARATEELDTERRTRVEAEQAAAVRDSHNKDLTERLQEERTRAEQAATTLKQEREAVKKVSDELSGARVAIETANARLESAVREAATAREDMMQARAEARKAFEKAAELRASAENADGDDKSTPKGPKR